MEFVDEKSSIVYNSQLIQANELHDSNVQMSRCNRKVVKNGRR